MNTINEQHTNDPKVYLYLERVSDLFSQINSWFQGELEIATGTVQIKEPVGTYEAPTLSVREKGQQEILANITPKSAGVILTEGMIEMKGWLDRIHLDYMTKGGPQVTLVPGKTRPVFKAINQDGWYWIVEMITWVSDHEF